MKPCSRVPCFEEEQPDSKTRPKTVKIKGIKKIPELIVIRFEVLILFIFSATFTTALTTNLKILLSQHKLPEDGLSRNLASF
ncbi:MAG TPA: hypothetical protein DCW97_01080 [Acidobacteria bacterium]|nr:hypothetical protein [Acidobacteriota bacterium]